MNAYSAMMWGLEVGKVKTATSPLTGNKQRWQAISLALDQHFVVWYVPMPHLRQAALRREHATRRHTLPHLQLHPHAPPPCPHTQRAYSPVAALRPAAVVPPAPSLHHPHLRRLLPYCRLQCVVHAIGEESIQWIVSLVTDMYA
jgi:hypothetical protein